MTFEEYIPLAMETAVFKDPLYPYASLLVESAELLDVFVKPLLRGDNGGVVDRDKVIKEAGDCLWNLAAICKSHGFIPPADSSDVVLRPSVEEALQICLGIVGHARNIVRVQSAASWPVEETMVSSVLYRVTAVLIAVNSTLDEALDANLAKLRSRAERGVLLGSGGER